MQLCDECGYIGITLIRVACGGKQFPYKNYILESAFFQIVCNLLVLVGILFSACMFRKLLMEAIMLVGLAL